MTAPRLDPGILNQLLTEHGFDRWVGVPDSTLEPLIEARQAQTGHYPQVATNECEAMSIAAGQFLASGRPSLVYLQNSGFGKTIHPITSLLAQDICAIPALLLIGWRASPGTTDEPQHQTMGRLMPALLTTLEIPHAVLTADPTQISQALQQANTHLQKSRTPYALVIRTDLLQALPPKPRAPSTAHPLRQEIILTALNHLPADTLFVATTGKCARELYALREARREPHAQDFYTVGGMGCASSIALGIAQRLRQQGNLRTVCVLDGDGAALMQLGTWASIGAQAPAHFVHLLIDNHAHESTGGQPTAATQPIAFTQIAHACGYAHTQKVETLPALAQALENRSSRGPHLIVAESRVGSDPKLARPTETPRQNVDAFLANLGVKA